MNKLTDAIILNNGDRVLSYIIEHPGCYLRKIRRELGISMGNTQYHLNELVKSGKITSARGGRRKFYFVNGVFGRTNLANVLEILSQDTARKILLLIIVNKNLTQSELTKILGISAGSINWHIKRLIEFNFVSEIKTGKYKKYNLSSDSKILVETLKNYKPGILDNFSNRLTNVFISLSEGISTDNE